MNLRLAPAMTLLPGHGLASLHRTSGRTPSRGTRSRIMSPEHSANAPRTEIRLGARRAGDRDPTPGKGGIPMT